MNDQDSKNWHSKTWVRVVVLLLLPLVIGGLFLISSTITLNRPTPAPVTPDTGVE